MRNFNTVTLQHLVSTQPWNVPYSPALEAAVADDRGLGHLMGTHITLHAAKTVGKLAAVFENLDHTGAPADADPLHIAEIRDKAADLVTAAMRLANLYGFDLARAVVGRSEEKNGVTLPPWPAYESHDRLTITITGPQACGKTRWANFLRGELSGWDALPTPVIVDPSADRERRGAAERQPSRMADDELPTHVHTEGQDDGW